MDAKRIVDRVWELIESRKIDALEAIVDADCHFKMPGMELHGFAQLAGMLAGYIAAFPDLKHHVRHHVTSGDTIALELEVTGTHTGPMQTPQGTVPATGKKVVWDSCDYIRFKDGK